MRRRISAALALIVWAGAAASQPAPVTPAPERPGPPPPAGQTPPERIERPMPPPGEHPPVINPPRVDSGIQAPAPVPNPNTTPVIPPPGAPGGDPTVRPR